MIRPARLYLFAPRGTFMLRDCPRAGIVRRPSPLPSPLTLVGLVCGIGLTSPAARAAGRAVQARNGMVVSVSPPGTDVGVAILKKGGNAVDAAVATAFAMAVTYPAAGNIGGGGFMLVYPPGGKEKPVVIEYRETAPRAATRTMFKRTDTVYSARAVGVPGTVRGLALAHQRFGRLPWKDVVLPAIHLAEDGFFIDDRLAYSLNGIVAASPGLPELRRVFGKAGGRATWRAGDLFVQKDLGRTLRLIAERGPDAFYKGPIADLILNEMKADGGLITREDLADYRAHA